MTVIHIDGRGVATLEIEAAGGEVHSYLVRPAPAGLDDWAVSLERDGAGPYRVAVAGRRWRCSCEAYRYRKGKDGPKGCKHTRSLQGLYALLRSLQASEVTP